jgi:hypothetical protein
MYTSLDYRRQWLYSSSFFLNPSSCNEKVVI